MPFCRKCRADLLDDAEFCSECGTPVVKTSRSQKKEASESVTGSQTQIRSQKPVYGAVSFDALPEDYLIANRYVVKEKVGQGGFGAVYRVFDNNMNIDKALKIIPEAILSDKEAMFDLQQEAQTMIALNHPNIVRVYDSHKTGDIKFIDMEYLDGKAQQAPLKQKLSTGKHILSVTKSDYKNIKTELLVSENTVNDFFLELESVMGSISVESEQEECEILLNGEKTGHKTPYRFTDIIPHSKQTIELQGNKYYSEKRQ